MTTIISPRSTSKPTHTFIMWHYIPTNDDLLNIKRIPSDRFVQFPAVLVHITNITEGCKRPMFSKSVLWYRERSQSQGEVLPSEKQKNMIAKLWGYSDEYSHGRSQSRSKQPATF